MSTACSFGHDGMGRNTPEGKATIARENKSRAEQKFRQAGGPYPQGKGSKSHSNEGKSHDGYGGKSSSSGHATITKDILGYAHNNPDQYAFTAAGKFKFNAHYEDGSVRMWYPGAELTQFEKTSPIFRYNIKRELFRSNQKIFDITKEVKESLNKISLVKDESTSLSPEQQYILQHGLSIIEDRRIKAVNIYMDMTSGDSAHSHPNWVNDIKNLESDIENIKTQINSIHTKYSEAKESRETKEKLDASLNELKDHLEKEMEESKPSPLTSYVMKCAYDAVMDVSVEQDYVDIALRGLKYTPYRPFATVADYAKDIYEYSQYAVTCYHEYQDTDHHKETTQTTNVGEI